MEHTISVCTKYDKGVNSSNKIEGNFFSPFMKLHLDKELKEDLSCASCASKLNSNDKYVTVVAAGGYENYCEGCYQKKKSAHVTLIAIPPLITRGYVQFLLSSLSICFLFLMHSSLWVCAPIIFLAILLDVYRHLENHTNMKESNKHTKHFKLYGTYDTVDTRNISSASMLANTDLKENVSHLSHFFKVQKHSTSNSKLANISYNLNKIHMKILNVLVYFRLVVSTSLVFVALVSLYYIFMKLSILFQ